MKKNLNFKEQVCKEINKLEGEVLKAHANFNGYNRLMLAIEQKDVTPIEDLMDFEDADQLLRYRDYLKHELYLMKVLKLQDYEFKLPDHFGKPYRV